MVRRRTLLRRGLGAVGVAGVTTLAGCQDDPTGDEGGDGTETDGSDGGGESSGPEWAAWLYDPAAVGEVDAHGFTTYDIGTLLSYRDDLPSEIDAGIQDAFDQIEGLDAESVDRIVGQGYGQVPPPEETPRDESPPVGWNTVATGSFETDPIVGRLAETDAYTEAGEYDGFQLFEGPSGNADAVTAVAVGSEAVIGGGAAGYDLPSTAAVERAIDANAGAVDRYYAAQEPIRSLMDRHGDGATATGVVDPDGSFEPYVQESTSAQEFDALLSVARAMGRSATVGEDETTTTLSFELTEPDPGATEDLQEMVNRAQEQRGNSNGPFSEFSVSADGTTLLVEGTADTEAALGTPDGLVVVAPEAAIAGSFVLNLGGSQRDPPPQIAFGYEQRDDGRMQIRHEGGDRTEELLVQYETESGDSARERWSEPDGISAGDTYVTEAVPEPGSDLRIIWEGDGRSAVVAETDVPS